MAFVTRFECDVFVSYATANNPRPNEGTQGWVTVFRDQLKQRLDEALGRRDASEVWMDYKLRGNEPFDEQIKAKVSKSAILLVVLSEAYLKSNWCQQELSTFVEAAPGEPGRIFLVHYGSIAPDRWLASLRGLSAEKYRFFHQERDGAIDKPLGYPIPNPDNRAHDIFYERMLELSRDLAAKLNDMTSQPPTTTPGKVHEANPWLVDHTQAIERLTTLELQDCLLPHRLQIEHPQPAQYEQQQTARDDPRLVDPLMRLCHDLPIRRRTQSGNSANRLILLCGDRGVGKTVLLWRLLADKSHSAELPGARLLLDFWANLDQCLKSGKPNFKEGILALVNQVERPAAVGGERAVPSPLLIVDGLDTVARHISTELKLKVGTLKTAPEYVEEAILECREQLASRQSTTLIVTLDISPDNGYWKPLFDRLRGEDTVVARVQPLPSPDQPDNFRRYYKQFVAQYDESYVAEREFLRLPIFLDCLRYIDGEQFEEMRTKLKCLEFAEAGRPKCDWQHHLLEVAKSVSQFVELMLSRRNVYNDEQFRLLLAPEWTGAWFELLEEEIKSSETIRSAMKLLFQRLRDKKYRWDLSATFALSNVITALIEADAMPKLGDQPHIEGEFSFCNLQRATFDRAIFKNTRFVAVDCREASFQQVEVGDSSRFIATDFTGCGEKWSVISELASWSPIFVECSGDHPGTSRPSAMSEPPA
jgi:hypothetical protein